VVKASLFQRCVVRVSGLRPSLILPSGGEKNCRPNFWLNLMFIFTLNDTYLFYDSITKPAYKSSETDVNISKQQFMLNR